MNADGTDVRQLTWGPFDDREPAYSPDGNFVAFASDRSGNYDIWLLDVRSGALRQLTTDGGDDFMPTFSPQGDQVAYVGTRGNTRGVYTMSLTTSVEQPLAGATGRVDAPSWGPDGTVVYHTTTGGASELAVQGTAITGQENAFAFRAGWLGAREIVYVSDGLGHSPVATPARFRSPPRSRSCAVPTRHVHAISTHATLGRRSAS